MRLSLYASEILILAMVLVLSPTNARAQFQFFQVAAAGQAAPADVGGAYTMLYRPGLDRNGRMTFKALVAGATAPNCPAGIDCQILVQTKIPGFNAFTVTTEGHVALVGQLWIIDDKPVNAEGKVYHDSCYGPGLPTIEGILRRTSTRDQLFLGGAACQTKFGQVAANRSGVAYWRALFEAVVFLADEPGAVPIPLVSAGDLTKSRLLGTFGNLGKAQSTGWGGLRRRVAMNSFDSVAFLSEVNGGDVDAACLGAEGLCDGIFIANKATGEVVLAVAKGDPLAGGGTFSGFCGLPNINDGGVVSFRALTDPAGDCDSLTGAGQGIYRIAPPFLFGSAGIVADSASFLPDETTLGSFTTGVFSDPSSDSVGNIYFRAGDPLFGGTTSAVIQASPPYGPTAYSVVAAKGAVADPPHHRFTEFDPDAPTVNSRGQMALLTGEGIFFGSPVSVLVSDCMDAILSVSQSLIRQETTALKGCAKKMLAGKIPQVNCRTQYATAVRKINAARSRASTKLARFCPDQVMPLINPCDQNNPDSQGQIDCLISIHEAVVDNLFQSWMPTVFP